MDVPDARLWGPKALRQRAKFRLDLILGELPGRSPRGHVRTTQPEEFGAIVERRYVPIDELDRLVSSKLFIDDPGIVVAGDHQEPGRRPIRQSLRGKVEPAAQRFASRRRSDGRPPRDGSAGMLAPPGRSGKDTDRRGGGWTRVRLAPFGLDGDQVADQIGLIPPVDRHDGDKRLPVRSPPRMRVSILNFTAAFTNLRNAASDPCRSVVNSARRSAIVTAPVSLRSLALPATRTTSVDRRSAPGPSSATTLGHAPRRPAGRRSVRPPDRDCRRRRRRPTRPRSQVRGDGAPEPNPCPAGRRTGWARRRRPLPQRAEGQEAGDVGDVLLGAGVQLKFGEQQLRGRGGRRSPGEDIAVKRYAMRHGEPADKDVDLDALRAGEHQPLLTLDGVEARVGLKAVGGQHICRLGPCPTGNDDVDVTVVPPEAFRARAAPRIRNQQPSPPMIVIGTPAASAWSSRRSATDSANLPTSEVTGIPCTS